MHVENTTAEHERSTYNAPSAVTAEPLANGGAPTQRRRARRARDLRFTLGTLALGVATVFALGWGGTALTSNSPTTRVAPTATSLPQGVVAAQPREFAVPGNNVGVMQPSVDGHGNIWFGEMTTNRLARLDIHSGKVTTWEPPNGRYNIMETAIDRHGDVWFTEQAGNYIGDFNPTTQRFTSYPLGEVNGRVTAPQALRFDAAGILWFTEVNSARIGRLDPATGVISVISVPVRPTAKQTFPYSMTLAPDGGIWFSELAGGALGRLDPQTHAVRLFTLPETDAQVFSLAADAQGRIWFTELQQGRLGMLNPATGAVVEKDVPPTLGRPAGLYAVSVATNGEVWFACSSVNALVSYSPPSDRFTFHQLPRPDSLPYGLTIDASGALWFTANALPTNYVGMLRV